MNTKQLKRLKPPGARLKKWARAQAAQSTTGATYEELDLTLSCRAWLRRKGLVLLLAVLAFPLLGAPDCMPPRIPACEPGAWIVTQVDARLTETRTAMCGGQELGRIRGSDVINVAAGEVCPDTHVRVPAHLAVFPDDAKEDLECQDVTVTQCIAKTYWRDTDCAFAEDELPAIPWLGCNEPRLVAPGPDESGDILFVRRGVQTLGTLITRVFIDHRGWLGDLGTGPREIAQCGDLPIRITVGGTPVGGVIAFESHVVQNPSEGVIEIPLDQPYTGQVVIGYEFLHDAATGTFSCLGTCADWPLGPGREEWCHDSDHPVKPDGCYDMAQGGDSPQPGFVASVTGIWTDADPGPWNP